MTTSRGRRATEPATPQAFDQEDLARLYRTVSRAKTEWEAAVDGVSDLVFLTDHAGKILRCNLAAQRSLSGPFHRILGRDLTRMLRTALANEELVLEDAEGEVHAAAGEPTFEYSKFPASHHGADLGWVFVFRDVTELRRLRSVAARIDMMNNLGQVLSSVRHEIGNPTNAMKTALSVMAESVREFSTEKMLSYIQRCLSDVQRIQVLLDRLRTFNLFEVSVEPRVDLRALLVAELPAIRDCLTGPRIHLIESLPPDGRPVETVCDPRAVYQILLGLIANSTEALADTAGAGRIRVALEEDEKQALLSVADSGPGIPPDQIDQVILPLFTTKPQGTGLGLAIAHEMVTRMGGTLEVGNDPDLGGARVVLQIPRSV